MRHLLILLACLPALRAAEVPAGTELWLRLRTPVNSAMAKPGQPVEGVLFLPVLQGERTLVASGVVVHGSVTAAAASGPERASLQLKFTELRDGQGRSARIDARLRDVDNARELVDDQGRILGIVGKETISSRIDQGLEKLAARNPALADILGGVKDSVVREADPEIRYEPGVELRLETQKPFTWTGDAKPITLRPMPQVDALRELVQRQPHRTAAVKDATPSDITNLMFVGTAEELEAAFAAAGYERAAELNTKSVLETVAAIAEVRGYKQAPMSVLLLDGERSQYDFQKGTNTFAMRHHLRVWRRPETFDGKPVWVASSTHDIGIDFSQENGTFIHKIDAQIDRERGKIVGDLLFTGRVQSLALVERPEVPTRTRNATGDEMVTDGRMAVVLLAGGRGQISGGRN